MELLVLATSRKRLFGVFMEANNDRGSRKYLSSVVRIFMATECLSCYESWSRS